MSRRKADMKTLGFTTKSLMKNSVVIGPPAAGAFRQRPPKPTLFRKFYEHGNFPIALKHDPKGHCIAWKVDIKNLDYHLYLPLFFDGLCETVYPYEFFARQGIHDMLEQGGPKIQPVIPKLITPIRNALNTRNHQIICTTLKVIQHLVTAGERVGVSLVPYYRQILPIFNIFKSMNLNSGDGIDYSQQKRQNVGDLIQETLEVLERYGGEVAFINIKYMVPTYESCMIKGIVKTTLTVLPGHQTFKPAANRPSSTCTRSQQCCETESRHQQCPGGPPNSPVPIKAKPNSLSPLNEEAEAGDETVQGKVGQRESDGPDSAEGS